MKPIKHLLLPLAAATTIALCVPAHAQGGFGGPGGPGGFQPPPAMMAKMQAWRHWRDSHKNVTALQRTLGALNQMEQDPQTKLNKTQAHAVLVVINRWKGKPALTDEQARQVNTQVTTPLNLQQIKAIATASQGRRGGFGGGGGGGRPGGGGFGGGRPGGPGGRPAFDPASFPSPRDYNPLNPATNPMVRARSRAQQRLAQLTSALAATK